MNSKIYLIPGLGADGRMYLPQLKVLPNAVVLEHQKPLKGESLVDYTRRLSAAIDTREPFVLVGTSLGGIISVEMGRIINPQKVILISSVKHRGEIPLWIRSMKYLKLHKLLTGSILVRFSNSNFKKLITRRDSAVSKVIADMHRDADPDFIEWAINEVVNWEGNKNYRKDIIHIHGTRDILFPSIKIKGAVFVKGGSHVMGLTQPNDVNKILLESLNNS